MRKEEKGGRKKGGRLNRPLPNPAFATALCYLLVADAYERRLRSTESRICLVIAVVW